MIDTSLVYTFFENDEYEMIVVQDPNGKLIKLIVNRL